MRLVQTDSILACELGARLDGGMRSLSDVRKALVPQDDKFHFVSSVVPTSDCLPYREDLQDYDKSDLLLFTAEDPSAGMSCPDVHVSMGQLGYGLAPVLDLILMSLAFPKIQCVNGEPCPIISLSPTWPRLIEGDPFNRDQFVVGLFGFNARSLNLIRVFRAEHVGPYPYKAKKETFPPGVRFLGRRAEVPMH